MNNNYIKLINNLETLKLERNRENIDTYINLINDGQKNIIDALYELTGYEIELRNERSMNAMVKVANFPFLKTLEDFDFSFQPSINKDKLIGFLDLRFLENRENILFIGTPMLEKLIWLLLLA